MVVPASARRAEDGEVSVWDSVDTEFKVHPSDADRVWGILCGMCEPDHIPDITKTVQPPPLTYSRRTFGNGDAEIVLRSFTHKRGSGDVFTKSSGVDLHSSKVPGFYGYVLFVQGSNETGDRNPILIPAVDWPNVEDALREYGAQEVQA